MCSVSQSCPTLWDPLGCSPPGSSVPGISQVKLLVWVAISFSRGSSWPRGWTCVFCIGRWIIYHWTTWEALSCFIFVFKCQLSLACLASCLGVYFLKHTYYVHAIISSSGGKAWGRLDIKKQTDKQKIIFMKVMRFSKLCVLWIKVFSNPFLKTMRNSFWSSLPPQPFLPSLPFSLSPFHKPCCIYSIKGTLIENTSALDSIMLHLSWLFWVTFSAKK